MHTCSWSTSKANRYGWRHEQSKLEWKRRKLEGIFVRTVSGRISHQFEEVSSRVSFPFFSFPHPLPFFPLETMRKHTQHTPLSAPAKKPTHPVLILFYHIFHPSSLPQIQLSTSSILLFAFVFYSPPSIPLLTLISDPDPLFHPLSRLPWSHHY